MNPFPETLAGEAFGYLTTIGRRTRMPREIEIWFALADRGETVYVMSGAPDRAQWVRNLRADPLVTFRIAGERREARAEPLGDGGQEDELARDLLVAKYATGGRTLDGWRASGLPVALRVQG